MCKQLDYITYIIEASLSEPLSVELAGAFLWYIIIIIYIIFVFMGSPFGTARVPVNVQCANVRSAE